MREYDDAVLECFLDKQLQLFPEAVAETLDEAEDFLEECMAVVVDSVEDVIEYVDEAGMDAVSYTLLDVYKRQDEGYTDPVL